MVKVQTTTVYGSLPHKQSVNVTSKANKTYGVSWPVGSNNGEYFSKSSGYRLIRNNMIQLLLTGLGERVMLPTFGTNLKAMLFENVSPLDLEDIKEQIVDAYNEFMPELVINNVDISIANGGDGTNTPEEISQLRVNTQAFQTTSHAYALRISAYYPDLDRDIVLDVPVLTSGGLAI